MDSAVALVLLRTLPLFEPQVPVKVLSPARVTGHIAGYKGHVPGYDHVAGRTFAKATKRALARSHVRHVEGESIPSSPQSYSKIPSNDCQPGHIPGYAGHVQGYMDM